MWGARGLDVKVCLGGLWWVVILTSVGQWCVWWWVEVTVLDMYSSFFGVTVLLKGDLSLVTCVFSLNFSSESSGLMPLTTSENST